MTVDQHATCQHRVYGLDCEQFEALLDRAERKCELCGKADIRLWLDHDHNPEGENRVRGLLCIKCNAHLGMVDRGARDETPAVCAYRAKALGAPGPSASRRTFVCSAGLWKEARDIAKARGESLSEVIRDALRRYVRRHQ